ncbi:hypothetical protein CB0940_11450 [Cercospora beticola]|uniref:Uncharacterized protein n=1 Tax=Cercospora beticola TaxID=122368 RepID=A0A2G5HFJ2_CERBT|nr:hypothetical protein CB0940_11450 [Cercospora beticola]PIA91003.1 hypothetical protein CB0940_11450 [Cercospora beticola]WPB08305.1 hypothetical protein RHO25_012971 [Cercospora beticola]
MTATSRPTLTPSEIDGASWGTLPSQPFRHFIDTRSAQVQSLPHSDSGLFTNYKTPFGEDHVNAPPTKLNCTTPNSSPPVAPVASVPVRQSTHTAARKETSVIPGATADDTIDVDSLTPQPQHRRTSTKGKKAARGRSLGERSTKPIKQLRMLAENDNLDAALKLGWSVERLTEIFNRNKAARGIHTTSIMQPIDDPELLARIEERKHNARVATQRRTNRLKERAHNGDFEAAKKLGLGKKTMDNLFPQPAGDRDGDQVKREQESLSPTEPRDFDEDIRRSMEHGHFDRYSRAGSMAVSEMGNRALKVESGETPFLPPRSTGRAGGGQRTTLRDSWGRQTDIPAFQPGPPYRAPTPVVPSNWPNQYPATMAPPNGLPPPPLPSNGLPPTTYPTHAHQPVIQDMALQLALERRERLSVLEWAHARVAETDNKIVQYQAYQARQNSIFHNHLNAADRRQVTQNGQSSGSAAADRDWTFVNQTGQEASEDEVHMVE